MHASKVAQSRPTLCDPRREDWRRFIFPPPGDLSDPGMEPVSPALAGKSLPPSLLRRWDSLVAQLVKSLPATWQTRVRSLGGEDPLEKGMAIHSSILAWKIPYTEEPGEGYSHGVAKSQTRQSDFTFFSPKEPTCTRNVDKVSFPVEHSPRSWEGTPDRRYFLIRIHVVQIWTK